MQRLVQVRLREAGQTLYFIAGKLRFKIGDCLIVEAERGFDYGQAASDIEEESLEDKAEESLRRVIRLASFADTRQIKQNKLKAKEAFVSCEKKIVQHKLDMKLVDAEFAFDRSKLIFYFTAEGRIDFRDLVKDLAHLFKTRIELRQIGVRDEAKFFGGFGSCGRELCCAKFLKEFEPVTIKMAKEQNLPLNPSKISGLCGRLMCCLSYEHKTYKQLCKGLPSEGSKITIREGKGRVVSVNPLKRSIIVEIEDGRHITVNYKILPLDLSSKCNREGPSCE